MHCLDKINVFREKLNSSNGVAIALTYAILLIDNMLLTAVVPVLPEYFLQEHQIRDDLKSQQLAQTVEISTTTASETTEAIHNLNKTNCRSIAESRFLINENLYIGLLFASKPLVQLVANFAVGPIVDRIGFDFPMLFGNIVMFISGLIFAFGTEYFVLLIARAIQGIGSASASVAAIAMIASRYRDDDEKRGKAISIGLGGLAMGVLIGPSFASGVYELAGKESVFVVLAVMAFALALIQVFVRGFHIKTETQMSEPIPLCTLLLDPYILLVAATLMIGNVGVGILEASMPLWMLNTMCSAKWELGIAFLPLSFGYLASINFVAVFCQKIPRWFVASLGLLFVAAGVAGVPFAKNLVELIPSGAVHGIGIGLVDASTFPIMATLVDIRHRAVYGSVYAIADISFCAAFILGPIYGGAAVRALGFSWLMWTFSIVAFLFSPFLLFLRKPTKLSEETMPILYNENHENDDVFPVGNKNGSMTLSPGANY